MFLRTQALCGLAVCALTKPEARKELVVLGKQRTPWPVASTSPASASAVPDGTPGHPQGRARQPLLSSPLPTHYPSDLWWFYLVASSRKLAGRLEVGERGRTLEPSGGLGLTHPPFPPSPFPTLFPPPPRSTSFSL